MVRDANGGLNVRSPFLPPNHTHVSLPILTTLSWVQIEIPGGVACQSEYGGAQLADLGQKIIHKSAAKKKRNVASINKLGELQNDSKRWFSNLYKHICLFQQGPEEKHLFFFEF